ncbi:MAG: triphosphoribosyl-dephospho-CoA synthase CitG [Pleomorphochaeta sp.]
MAKNKYLSNNVVSLNDILALRDNRQQLINDLIKEYNKTIIILSLNIVGPIKVFNLSIKTFYEGNSLILDKLNLCNCEILYHHINKSNCGYEGYYVLDVDHKFIKKQLSEIEDTSSLGRLFDIDVISNNGLKISREDLNLEGRKCILCDNPVFLCSRSRNHSVTELIDKEIEIMISYFAEKMANDLSQLAMNCLILEVKTTPKPGLVDLNNNGSHKDMDINLFINSAKVLKPFFYDFFKLGFENKSTNINQLLPQLRKLGIEAEKAMINETKGINTHKGSIFIYSLILCSLGWLYSKSNYSKQILIQTIKDLSKDFIDDFKLIKDKDILSNGEKIFLQYGILGVRGEAINGFEVVLDKLSNKYNSYISSGYSINDSGCFVLLDIILEINDTNIISRSNYNVLLEIKTKIKQMSKIDGRKKLDFITQLDKEFIEKNISAGGSADLLALIYFIYYFESKFVKNFDLINS